MAETWKSFCRALLLGLTLANLILLFWLVPAVTSADLSIEARHYKDSIKLALNLGRLDLVTALLAVMGITIGGFALIGYTNVQRRAEDVAKKTAEQIAPNEARQAVEAEMPSIIAGIYRFLQGEGTAEEADAIAEAQEGGNAPPL